jgi:hypothetical protein
MLCGYEEKEIPQGLSACRKEYRKAGWTMGRRWTFGGLKGSKPAPASTHRPMFGCIDLLAKIFIEHPPPDAADVVWLTHVMVINSNCLILAKRL